MRQPNLKTSFVILLIGLLQFFLNVFRNFREFSDKNICLYSKRAQSHSLLCKRSRCYHSASKTQVTDMIHLGKTALPLILCNRSTRNCLTFTIQYNFLNLFPFFLIFHFKRSYSSQTVILNSCHTDRNCSCFTGLLHSKSVSFLVIEQSSSHSGNRLPYFILNLLSGNRDHALFQVSCLTVLSIAVSCLWIERPACLSPHRNLN